LKIEESAFQSVDLNNVVDLHTRFDLAICLEVAEHLLPESAANIVKTIVNHSDVILFSAAVPGQGGQYHINEQWPQYWQELFRQSGYEMVDFFRPLIWENNDIEYWYRQNLFLVVRNGHHLENAGSRNILPLVHPRLFEKMIRNKNEKIDFLRASLEKLSRRDIIGRLGKLLRR
jgi:hypothetical protein